MQKIVMCNYFDLSKKKLVLVVFDIIIFNIILVNFNVIQIYFKSKNVS